MMKTAFIFLLSVVGLPAVAFPSSSSLNVRMNPVSLLAGGLNAGVDLAMGPQWAVGPFASYFSSRVDSGGLFLEDFNVKSSSLGLRATWLASRSSSDSFYLAPLLQYTHSRVITKDLFGHLSGQASSVLAGVYAGKIWFWDNLSLMLGAGYRLPLRQGVVRVTNSLDRSVDVVGVRGELSAEIFMGWWI